MKKLIVIALAAIFAIPMFNACKKGENDPTLSLKSRKARLTGEWELKSGSITYTSGAHTSITTYTGTTATSGSFTSNYTEKVEIEKDHTFKMTITAGSGTQNAIATIEGTWSFGRKDKELELKNKEYIVTRITSVSDPSNITDYGTATATGTSCPTETWVIDQLKNKEMVILTDGMFTSAGSSSTSKGTKTYEKK